MGSCGAGTTSAPCAENSVHQQNLPRLRGAFGFVVSSIDLMALRHHLDDVTHCNTHTTPTHIAAHAHIHIINLLGKVILLF